MSGDDKTVIKGAPSQYVKLNVGGTCYYTTTGTLTKYDSMLRAMFSGGMESLTDSEGWIIIDRCGKHFGRILNFLRDGSVPLPESSSEIEELLAEAKYYLIQELVKSCESTLKNRQPADFNVEAFCRVVHITSARELQSLITSSPKPVVEFSTNLQTYEGYSTSASSDRNLLKNMELFNKVSLRFSEQILFVKDGCVSNDICTWSFYVNSRNVSEVNCTPNRNRRDQYAEVDFPEARIYEEILKIPLYEKTPYFFHRYI